MGEFIAKVVAVVVGLAVMVFVISLIMALPTMWLWNYVMVGTFGLPALTFGKALGLNMLCGILFKSSSSGSKD